MNKSLKNVLYLLGAFAAGFLLQVVAAFAVMLPAMVVKMMQIMSMGLTGTEEETAMLTEVSTDMMGPAVLVTHIVLLVTFGLWYVFGCCKERNGAVTFRKTFGGKNLIIILMLALGGCYLTNFFMPIASLVIPDSIMQAYIDLMETAGFGNSILPTIAAVLIAPFGEELIFRGVMYHYAGNLVEGMSNRKTAFYIANIIQALAFGIFHGNIIQGTYAFCLGLLFGYMRQRFGSIWASILAHMVVNGVSSFLWEPLFYILPGTIFVFAAGTAVSLVIVVIGMKLGGPAISENHS